MLGEFLDCILEYWSRTELVCSVVCCSYLWQELYFRTMHSLLGWVCSFTATAGVKTLRTQDTSDPTFRHYQTGAELSRVSTSITHAKMPTLCLMLSLH